jgi:hypothetical protein
MVRSPLDGQLTAPAEVRFARATAADDAAIRRLLRENPLRGKVSLTFEREPDYFRGTQLAGAEDETMVAYAGSRLVGLGRCVTRPCWVNGAVERVGYFGELRLDPAARGRATLARQGYACFRDLQRSAPAAHCFTSIAEDNVRARRLLERGLPGWPHYEFLTAFTTVLLATVRRRSRDQSASAAPEAGEVADFLNTEGARTHLATAWTAARVRSLAAHGLRLEDFHVRRAEDRIVAVAALWDQRSFRQTVIRGYAGALGWLRPALNGLGRVLRWPLLPAPGSVLAQAFVSPLAVHPEHTAVLPGLLADLGDAAARSGLTHLTLGFPADDPRLAVVRGAFPVRTYSTRLYSVSWPDEAAPPPFDRRPFAPDLAFL